MEITGKITKITEEMKVGKNQTDKQTVIVEELEGKYPNSIAIDFMGDKVMMSRNLHVGDEVNIKYNAKANEYNDKVYNNIRAWSLDVISETKQNNDSTDDDLWLPF